MKPVHQKKENPYRRDRLPLVAKVPVQPGDFLNERILAVADLLGGLDLTLSRGDSVMIKPNFNCAFRTPLSTDPGILKALIEVLLDSGLKVTIGESSGRGAGPTEGVVARLGLPGLLKWYNAPFINFEEDEWVEMEIPGKYWKSIRVPRSMYEAEKRVYLSNARCHSSARFSGSMKLSVGWLAPEGRDFLHQDKDTTDFKVPELNLGWQPDFILMDLRQTTVSWHGRGDYVFPKVMMASGDMQALDREAVSILKSYPGDNRIDLPMDELGQFVAAGELGIGSKEYLLVEGEAHLGTEEQGNNDPAALEILMERNRKLGR